MNVYFRSKNSSEEWRLYRQYVNKDHVEGFIADLKHDWAKGGSPWEFAYGEDETHLTYVNKESHL